MTVSANIELKAVNTIRFLSADGVQKANSGHPGLPMGAAAMAYTIWKRHLHIDPQNPKWINRDRFILSGGHGSMLLYSLLYLTGFDVTIDDLKSFRQWGSKTPGHPEYGLTAGIDTTTGPLGQGLANGVGMAIAERHLAAEFNRPGQEVIDHFTYGIVTDGDLMEGVASEAASLAGTLGLGKIIYLYDDNHISIDGPTELSFTEDRGKRFEAYGWHVSYVSDGNDIEAIDQAIVTAKQDARPSLIVCRTHIGFGLPTRQDTEKAHGEPPGVEELAGAKRNLNWPEQPDFFVPDEVLEHMREIGQSGHDHYIAWSENLVNYRGAFPSEAIEFDRRVAGQLPKDWNQDLINFPADAKGQATRVSSGKALNAIAARVPELVGGSADLTPSTKTWIDSSKAFNHENHLGRNFNFGVREHGMGAIVNGMAYHGGFIPYGATFLVFSDYMRGSIRVSAISHLQSIWVFTHDSIGLGEDGPTHQPVEHLMSLRLIPNLSVIRPADANETAVAWQIAVERRDGPTALILSRQNVPTVDRTIFSSADETRKGAYILREAKSGKPDCILMASGTEVQIALNAANTLSEEGVNVRVVSFPSWDLFMKQPADYQNEVLPADVKIRVAIETGTTIGWERWVGSEGFVIGIDHYGASAPAEILYKEFGFTAEAVVKKVNQLLNR